MNVNKIKEEETIGGTFGTKRRERELAGKTEGKRRLRKSNCRWENAIKLI